MKVYGDDEVDGFLEAVTQDKADVKACCFSDPGNLRRLGSGGFNDVYECREDGYALKVGKKVPPDWVGLNKGRLALLAEEDEVDSLRSGVLSLPVADVSTCSELASTMKGGVYSGARSVLKKLPMECEARNVVGNTARDVKGYIDSSLAGYGADIGKIAVAYLKGGFDRIENLWSLYVSSSDKDAMKKECFYCVVAAIYSHEILNSILSSTKDIPVILRDQTPANAFVFLTHLADEDTIERAFLTFRTLVEGLAGRNESAETWGRELSLFILEHQQKRLFGFRTIFIDVDPGFTFFIQPVGYYQDPANMADPGQAKNGDMIAAAYPGWREAYMYYLWMLYLSTNMDWACGNLAKLYRTSGEASASGPGWIWNAEKTAENRRIFEDGFIFAVDEFRENYKTNDEYSEILSHYARAGTGGVLGAITDLFASSRVSNSDVVAALAKRKGARPGKRRASPTSL